MRIEFIIPWRVAPKQSVRVGTKFTSGRVLRKTFRQTKKIKRNAASLALYARRHCPDPPLEGPLRVSYVVTYPYLKRHTKRERAAGPIPKDARPDVDQLAKQLNDVLEAVGFFRDDGQIAQLHVSKRWGAMPGVWVAVEPAIGVVLRHSPK